MILMPLREQLSPFPTAAPFSPLPVGEIRPLFLSDLHLSRENRALTGAFRRCSAHQPDESAFPHFPFRPIRLLHTGRNFQIAVFPAVSHPTG